jgi:hypothetical protein
MKKQFMNIDDKKIIARNDLLFGNFIGCKERKQPVYCYVLNLDNKVILDHKFQYDNQYAPYGKATKTKFKADCNTNLTAETLISKDDHMKISIKFDTVYDEYNHSTSELLLDFNVSSKDKFYLDNIEGESTRSSGDGNTYIINKFSNFSLNSKENISYDKYLYILFPSSIYPPIIFIGDSDEDLYKLNWQIFYKAKTKKSIVELKSKEIDGVTFNPLGYERNRISKNEIFGKEEYIDYDEDKQPVMYYRDDYLTYNYKTEELSIDGNTLPFKPNLTSLYDLVNSIYVYDYCLDSFSDTPNHTIKGYNAELCINDLPESGKDNTIYILKDYNVKEYDLYNEYIWNSSDKMFKLIGTVESSEGIIDEIDIPKFKFANNSILFPIDGKDNEYICERFKEKGFLEKYILLDNLTREEKEDILEEYGFVEFFDFSAIYVLYTATDNTNVIVGGINHAAKYDNLDGNLKDLFVYKVRFNIFNKNKDILSSALFDMTFNEVFGNLYTYNYNYAHVTCFDQGFNRSSYFTFAIDNWHFADNDNTAIIDQDYNYIPEGKSRIPYIRDVFGVPRF